MEGLTRKWEGTAAEFSLKLECNIMDVPMAPSQSSLNSAVFLVLAMNFLVTFPTPPLSSSVFGVVYPSLPRIRPVQRSWTHDLLPFLFIARGPDPIMAEPKLPIRKGANMTRANDQNDHQLHWIF